MERTRTVTWRDPALGVEAGTTLTGVEYLRAMARGDAPPPPLALVLGFRLEDIEEGKVMVTWANAQQQPRAASRTPQGRCMRTRQALLF